MGYLQTIIGDQEQVLFLTRRHWLVIARSIIASVLLALIIVAATVVLVGVMTNTSYSANRGMAFLLLLLLLLPFGRLLTTYMAWHNEQYIVTNRRIIQIDGIFNKHVIDSSLEKVNDIEMAQTFMGRLLGYGDMEILTASDIGVNKLKTIANPILFKTTLLNAKEGLSDPDVPVRRAQVGPKADKTVPELIDELAELRTRGVITEDEFQAKKKDLMSRM